MRRRSLTPWLIAATALTGCDRTPSPTEGRVANAAVQGRPSVILYIVDTLRADGLGCYGNPVVDTPASDRLASEGTLFENAIAPSSWTRPSVASLLSGLSPAVHGAVGRDHQLTDRVDLISEKLQRLGYSTAFIGTNPNSGSVFGFDQGFDDFIELYGRREPGFVDRNELITDSGRVTDRAIRWIDSATRPFFLTILTVDPHTPYRPPSFFDRYARESTRTDLSHEQQRTLSLYHGEIAFNDHSFGRLLDHLTASDLDRDTVVALTGDHGEEFWEHGKHGHSQALYGESIRVPLIVRYPGVVEAGRRVEDTVETTALPELLLDLVAQRRDDADPPRPLTDRLAETGVAFSQLQNDDYNLFTVRADPWKLIWDLRTGEKRLFNLAEDPAESRDLAASHPDELQRLEGWMEERLRADAALFTELHGSSPRLLSADEEVPEEVRKTLEALGYLGN